MQNNDKKNEQDTFNKVNENMLSAETLAGDTSTEEEHEQRKMVQIHNAVNFTIFILAFVVVLEALDHVYILKLPGSPL